MMNLSTIKIKSKFIKLATCCLSFSLFSDLYSGKMDPAFEDIDHALYERLPVKITQDWASIYDSLPGLIDGTRYIYFDMISRPTDVPLYFEPLSNAVILKYAFKPEVRRALKLYLSIHGKLPAPQLLDEFADQDALEKYLKSKQVKTDVLSGV